MLLLKANRLIPLVVPWFFLLPVDAAAQSSKNRGIFPDVSFRSCQAARNAALGLIKDRDKGMESYRNLGVIHDAIVRSRVFKVTIISRHGKALTAKLETQSENLARFRKAKTASSWLSAAGVPVTRVLQVWFEVVDALVTHPNEELPVDVATGKIKRLDAERENLLKSIRKLQQNVYCTEVLPRELTLNSIHGRASDRACTPVQTSDLKNELMNRHMIRWGDIPGESRGLPRGSSDHPQFFTGRRLTSRAADCQSAGYRVMPTKIAGATAVKKCSASKVAGKYDAGWGPIHCRGSSAVECTYGRATKKKPKGEWSLHLRLNPKGDKMVGSWDHNDGKTGPVEFGFNDRCELGSGSYGYKPGKLGNAWAVRKKLR